MSRGTKCIHSNNAASIKKQNDKIVLFSLFDLHAKQSNKMSHNGCCCDMRLENATVFMFLYDNVGAV